jgi:DNA ligase-1
MLATDYNPLKFKAEGSYMSEKLDGVRAIWIPFSRGMKFTEVPWANRAKDDREYACSGLWTRRGKPIVAPDWFLNQLPKDKPLDGELFIDRNLFNKTIGTVRKLTPVDDEWKQITYQLFDIPSYQQLFRDGWIREGGKAGEPAYEVFMRSSWIDQFNLRNDPYYPQRRFTDVLNEFESWPYWNEVCYPLQFVKLPFSQKEATEYVAEALVRITTCKGEGLMLRRGHTVWEPIRHPELVKVKKMKDSEATVIGYVFGEGKYLGMVGAFRVNWNGVVFDLSGFTDEERQIEKMVDRTHATANPGVVTHEPVSTKFPIGSTITFRYNEVTPEGKPRFARYWRQYEAV